MHCPNAGSKSLLPNAVESAAGAPVAADSGAAGDDAAEGAAAAAGTAVIETPWHDRDPFTVQLLAPTAFKQLWTQFGIQAGDLVTAICSRPLIEISNPGASGSEFYKSWDDQFFLKSASKAEFDFLIAMMPSYLATLVSEKRTVLPKFFGAITFAYDDTCSSADGADRPGGATVTTTTNTTTPRRRSSIFRSSSRSSAVDTGARRRSTGDGDVGSSAALKRRFIIMNNILPSRFKYSLRFDLKGSTFKRFANPEEVSI